MADLVDRASRQRARSPPAPTGRPRASGPTSATRPRTASPRSRSPGPRCATRSGPHTLVEVDRALQMARNDGSVGVIVLTGEGPLAFCSGGDQNVRGDTGYIAEGEEVGRFHVTDLQVAIRRCPKPVVAMVAGYAIGGGHVLHVVCDLTIAADNARFGQTGPQRRLVRRRLRGQHPVRPGGPEEGQGDLVPVPPVRRRGGRADGPGEHRGPAGGAGDGDRGAGRGGCWSCRRSRCAC